ncbi:hypothetical protein METBISCDRAFT_24025 [Metschnikowia bicuspidata]|uniref:Coatomer subunit delta n=1 Tax=Metschnikowia bicuspidata TaxID=27322 RepID=A0A4P9ZAA3_9ASCO|nr:hypothetical protein METBISCDRAFT_24025 [Metschnikowia bicuspidata]
MVVLAAAICTHSGKPLLSRLFRDLNKDRIALLLANFPSLLVKSESHNTTVEDDNMRYVYQSVGECCVVLLTTKQSNILEDIEALHLFVGITSHMLRTVDERGVFENAFELLSAFDEIVTMGYNEKLIVQQVHTFLEMDSHEEKIQEIIQKNKELEAAEERRRRAKEIQRKEFERRAMELQQAALYGSAGGPHTRDNFNYGPATPVALYDVPSVPELAPEPAMPKPIGGKGMKLGKPTRLSSNNSGQGLLLLRSSSPLLSAPKLQQEPVPVFAPIHTELVSTLPASSSTPGASQKLYNNGVLITVNEKISAHINHEGGIVASEVKGELNLRINNAELARSKILLQVDNTVSTQYKTHPNVDRALFSDERIIALKDRSKPFPSIDQNLGVLRWKSTGKEGDSSLVPLLFTAWVNMDDSTADVTLEYELSPEYVQAHPLQESFGSFSVILPISLDDVILKEDSSGFVLYSVGDAGVEFSVEKVLLSSAQGSFEFSIPAGSEEDLFPMEVRFKNTFTATESDKVLGGVSVLDVVTNDDQEASLPFDFHVNVITENYLVD